MCAYWHTHIRKICSYDTCMRSSLISELHCTHVESLLQHKIFHTEEFYLVYWSNLFNRNTKIKVSQGLSELFAISRCLYDGSVCWRCLTVVSTPFSNQLTWDFNRALFPFNSWFSASSLSSLSLDFLNKSEYRNQGCKYLWQYARSGDVGFNKFSLREVLSLDLR